MSWLRYQSIPMDGINGSTGRPLFSAPPVEEIGLMALEGTRHVDEAEGLWEKYEICRDPDMRLCSWADPSCLDQTGWGIVWPHGIDAAIREALSPLIEHRKLQVKNEALFRELTYRPGDTKVSFTERYGKSAGPVDPLRIPYYLVLVGSPEQIPFSFQYQLGLQFAVGRIGFENPEDYERYAASVVASESETGTPPKRAVFFSPTHRGDDATKQAFDLLAQPLASAFENRSRFLDWQTERVFRGDATRDRWAEILGKGSARLVFSSSHGLGFEPGESSRRELQGALLCSDWQGLRGWEDGRPVPREAYFAGEDVGEACRVAGTLFFYFACFGAGTSTSDGSSDSTPETFLARLPQRLLAHPRGGALAFVGHVNRAWSCVFTGPQSEAHIDVFESTLVQLLHGRPIGAAMEDFRARWAELAADLSSEVERLRSLSRPPRDLRSLAGLWTAHNDARAYVILGDPAVRLTTVQGGSLEQ